jgi:hypothetical protein
MTNGRNNVWYNPQAGVSPFKLFLSMDLRTLCHNGRPLTHLLSITSALFPIQRRGECPFPASSLAACSSRLPRASRGASIDRSPHATLFCFQSVTNCPICNPFVFITLQQWGGYPSVQTCQNGKEVKTRSFSGQNLDAPRRGSLHIYCLGFRQGRSSSLCE